MKIKKEMTMAAIEPSLYRIGSILPMDALSPESANEQPRDAYVAWVPIKRGSSHREVTPDLIDISNSTTADTMKGKLAYASDYLNECFSLKESIALLTLLNELPVFLEHTIYRYKLPLDGDHIGEISLYMHRGMANYSISLIERFGHERVSEIFNDPDIVIIGIVHA